MRSALSALDAWVESYKAPARVESYKAPAPRVPPLNLVSLPVPTRQGPRQHRAQGGEAPTGGFDAAGSSEVMTDVPHHDQSRQADEDRQGEAAGAPQGNISQPGLRAAGIFGEYAAAHPNPEGATGTRSAARGWTTQTCHGRC